MNYAISPINGEDSDYIDDKILEKNFSPAVTFSPGGRCYSWKPLKGSVKMKGKRLFCWLPVCCRPK